jgi:hypothetical protein
MKNKTKANKIDDPRTRMTCEQDRSVCDFAYLVMRIWPHCNLLMYQMTVICVCVILHHKRHACVIISVQYNFLYDLPTHL